jgi:hypothetical protein
MNASQGYARALTKNRQHDSLGIGCDRIKAERKLFDEKYGKTLLGSTYTGTRFTF